MVVSLKGTNILVTGGGRGIGAAVALACGRAGARVAVHYHSGRASAEKVAGLIGRGSAVFGADLADPKGCEDLFRKVTGTLGRLDVLVNNAGIFIRSPLASRYWTAEWDRTMAVNLRAPGILSRLAVRHFMGRKKGGRIITITSRAAFRGDDAPYLAYAASKAGLVALSRSIARSFGRFGVSAFLIAPGWVKTDMARDALQEYGVKKLIAEQAIGRRLTVPEDIAPLAVLLASGLADHATGTTIDVNAGSYVH